MYKIARSRLLITRNALRCFTSLSGKALDFSNTKIAYAHLSDNELLRSLLVLRMCSVDALVDNSLQLMHYCERMLPSGMFRWLMESTMYGHFVPGETHEDVARSVKKFQSSGICFFPAASVEDELTEGETESEPEVEAALDKNVALIADSIHLADILAGKEDKKNAKVAMKLSAIIKPRLLKLLSTSISENGHIPIANSSELHSRMEEAASASGLRVQYNNGVERLDSLIKNVRERGISVFIDAEHGYMQPAICSLVLYMQSKYNTDRHLTVFNTHQTYLKKTEEAHQRNLEIAKLSGFQYATKVVRGAYMAFERTHARQQHRPDPIQDTFKDTTRCYHHVINDMMGRASAGEGAVMAATQNENTVNFVIQRMGELKISRDSGQVTFAQQLGMADHITFQLGQAGYLVYKYSPYGSISNTLAYLCRRAQENCTVLKELRQENKLLAAEWTRRYQETKKQKAAL